MLIPIPQEDRQVDPMLAMIAKINGNNFEIVEEKVGIYRLDGRPVSPDRHQGSGQIFEELIKRAFGDDVQTAPTNTQILEALSKQWEVFHIIVEEGSHMRSYRNEVIDSWTKLMGQRAILLADVGNLSEVMVSAIEVIEGKSIADVVGSWSGDTSMVVAKAVSGLNSLTNRPEETGAVTRFR